MRDRGSITRFYLYVAITIIKLSLNFIKVPYILSPTYICIWYVWSKINRMLENSVISYKASFTPILLILDTKMHHLHIKKIHPLIFIKTAHILADIGGMK